MEAEAEGVEIAGKEKRKDGKIGEGEAEAEGVRIAGKEKRKEWEHRGRLRGRSGKIREGEAEGVGREGKEKRK